MSSPQQPELRRLAGAFARETSRLLNGTVTDGIRISAFMEPEGSAVVGYRVAKNRLRGSPIPLTVSKSPARLHLRMLHTLVLDDSGEFLTAERSTCILQAGDAEATIFAYDYVREPPNDYPEAHIHLYGKCEALRAMLDMCGLDKRQPADLHLPVGGRRFRPCLEDVIEFCIVERLVTPRQGWESALGRGRGRYHETQLRAAVRRNPTPAADVLRHQGWQVIEPAA